MAKDGRWTPLDFLVVGIVIWIIQWLHCGGKVEESVTTLTSTSTTTVRPPTTLTTATAAITTHPLITSSPQTTSTATTTFLETSAATGTSLSFRTSGAASGPVKTPRRLLWDYVQALERALGRISL